VQDSDEVTNLMIFALMEIVRHSRTRRKGKKDERVAVARERNAIEAIRVAAGVVDQKQSRKQDRHEGPPTFRIELVEPMKPGEQPSGAAAEPAQPDEKTAGGPEGASGAA